MLAAVTDSALSCYGHVTNVDFSDPLGLEDDGSIMPLPLVPCDLDRNMSKKSPGKSRMSSKTQFIPIQSKP